MKFRFKLLIAIISVFVCISSVFCAQKKEIILQDNTVLYGDVIGLANGVYKIKTHDMGILTISEDKVVSIKNKSAGNNIANQDINDLQFASTNPANPIAVEAGVNAVKNRMQADPAIMKSIADLQNDPDFMDIITDPEIMSAINSGDVNALNSNPKFIKLMNNSKIKRISDYAK